MSRAAIGIIGCGNMGQALIKGMLAARIVSPKSVVGWDADRAKLRKVAGSTGIRAGRSNLEAASVRTLLLAVKPQQMDGLLKQIAPHLAHRPLIISIAAGISTKRIERRTGRSVPVVRVMPNTPALVRAGISAVAPGRAARAAHLKSAERILSCVGGVVRVPESWMNAVTAVSGSGPAYFFYLMEQMIGAGVKLGLSREAARRLVLQTALGAAALAAQSADGPDLLRARVTSEGGTTEAAFKVFARRKLGPALQAGVLAAAARARKLGG